MKANMKEKTKKTVAKRARGWKTGPEKEKAQITVRIDQKLMQVVDRMMTQSNMRITDMVERGLLLAMEEEYRVPLLASQVRFLFMNTTRAQQEILRRCLTFLRVDEVRPPTPIDNSIRRFIGEYFESMDRWGDQVMDLYARYGRTEAEVEKLKPEIEKMTG